MPDSSAVPDSYYQGTNEFVFNILLLGEGAVGKSTLANAFVNGVRSTAYIPTVGVDFYFRNVHIDGFTAKLQLWDTAGQTQFMTFLNESYFQRANSVILMYDVTQKSSFKSMKLWIEHIKQHCKATEKMIVGNKLDLADQRQVDESRARNLANKSEFELVEMCSFDARSVDRLFLQLTRSMILSHLRMATHQIASNPPPSLNQANSLLLPKRRPNISNNSFRDDCDLLFKILLVGEASVGKTSLMCRYVHQRFNGQYRSTIGVDFEAHIVKIDEKLVKLQIWDTAGQERFKALSPQYYRGADAIVIVYDVSNRHSFDKVQQWVHSVKAHNADETVIALVGNKCDLDTNLKEIDKKLGNEFGENLGVDLFMETSAKASTNVVELFETLAKKAIAKKNINLSELESSVLEMNNRSVVRPGMLNASKSASSRWSCCS